MKKETIGWTLAMLFSTYGTGSIVAWAYDTFNDPSAIVVWNIMFVIGFGFFVSFACAARAFFLFEEETRDGH